MKVLIIGLGSIARKHILAIKYLRPEAIIYALRSTETATEVDGVHNIFTLDDLTLAPDFVIISNPTSLHGVTIKQCLSLGCPLFIEKPVLNDLAEAEYLNKVISLNKLITYVACNLRLHPVLGFIKEYLEKRNDRINEVNIYCGSYLPDWRPGVDFRKVYSAHTDLGGGVHLDLIHELDYCFWLFGYPEKVTSLKRNVSSLNIHSIDSAQYHLIYSGFTADISLNYFRRDAKRTIEIVTENETIECDLIKNTVKNIFTGEALFYSEKGIADTYILQMEYFINCLQSQTIPMNNFSESVKVLKMALHE